jgi:hypothetical protein
MAIHLWPARQRHVPRALDVADITRVADVATYYAGLGFTYYVFFYSFFNWWHYREMRERWHAEDDEDDD